MTDRWNELADRLLAGERLSRPDALAMLGAADTATLPMLQAMARLRERHYGRRVRLHILLNAKSGMCTEDCGFCPQSSAATGPVERHQLLSVEEIVEAARAARAAGGWKFCIVTSTRGPSDVELGRICEAVRRIKAEIPIRVCTSLGLLNREQAAALKSVGVDRFNHNLETAEHRFAEVCTTHTYQDRVDTVRLIHEHGIESCCGGIIGMGETDGDIVDLCFALRDLDVSSIPVNFLNPRPGTAQEGANGLTPWRCLRVLAMFRAAHPAKDLRVAGGREVNLRSLQPLSLLVVNSIFTNGYLTTPGQGEDADRRMIRDMGYEIEVEEGPAPAGAAPARAIGAV